MYTFQDFEQATDIPKFVLSAINWHKTTEKYKTALIADEYDAHRNVTIRETVRKLFTASGTQVEDFTASNNKIGCNLFNRLNTQRCMYSLGAGVSFVDPYEMNAGETDTTKEKLGKHFDHTIMEAGYHALIHGESYLFWNLDRVYEFTLTEFVALDDENDGSMKAGIRFWQIDANKPLNAVLYESDGYTKMRSDKNGNLEIVEPKRAYIVTYQYTEADEDVTVLDEENYPSLPIVRMYGSRLKQSTLVGMREAIDSFDLIQSGFANDLTDCAQIYWILENYNGMDENDLAEFLDRIKLNHIAVADTSQGGKVAPYTQDIPYQARKAYLDDIRARIYEDFGALDVHTISAGATNDHIDAGYQPLDENAADFERWVGEAIIQLLELQGIDDTPVFSRSRISNQLEQVQILVQESQWLDHATILRKLPNITPDEYNAILENFDKENMERMETGVEDGNSILNKPKYGIVDDKNFYKITSILKDYKGKRMNRKNAIIMLESLGMSEQEAKNMLEDSEDSVAVDSSKVSGTSGVEMQGE